MEQPRRRNPATWPIRSTAKATAGSRSQPCATSRLETGSGPRSNTTVNSRPGAFDRPAAGRCPGDLSRHAGLRPTRGLGQGFGVAGQTRAPSLLARRWVRRVGTTRSGTALLRGREPIRSAIAVGGSGIRSPPPPHHRPPPGPGAAMKMSLASWGWLARSGPSDAVVKLTVVRSATTRITSAWSVVDISADSPCDRRSAMLRFRRAPPRTPGRATAGWTVRRPSLTPWTASSASACDTNSPSTVGTSALAINCLMTQGATPRPWRALSPSTVLEVTVMCATLGD